MQTDLPATLKAVLDAAKERGYSGFDKHDGLQSPYLAWCMGNRLLRLAAIQLVMRSPVNLRSLLKIPATINPKGLGLFASANLIASSLFDDVGYMAEAKRLLEQLLQLSNTSMGGRCWGYQYPWQDAGFFAPAGSPNRVVTCWIGMAFYKMWEATHEESYLDVCVEICGFLRGAPNRIVDTGEELCFSYVPDTSVRSIVMDVSALCGRMFAWTAFATNDKSLQSDARRCMKFVVNRQTAAGAWFYGDPPESSHITHDNYHTGIILDCLRDYCVITKDPTFSDAYERGLAFYRSRLFLPSGAPKWMHDRTFPHDVHGAAQGVLTFCRTLVPNASALGFSRTIADWTIANLYDPCGRQFWYRANRLGIQRISFMRWCNGWMGIALAELCVALSRQKSSYSHFTSTTSGTP